MGLQRPPHPLPPCSGRGSGGLAGCRAAAGGPCLPPTQGVPWQRLEPQGPGTERGTWWGARKRKMQLPPVASPTLSPQSPESDMTGCGLDPGPRPGQLGLFAFCLVNQANHVGLERGILATSSWLGLFLPHHHRCWALWAGRDQFLPQEPGLPTWVVSVGPKTVGLASVPWVMDGVSY